MLKYLLTVEASFSVRGRGIILVPPLAATFIDQLKERSFTARLIFADGRQQDVKGYFSLTHMWRTPPTASPTWVTECLLEESIGSVPKGTQLWWNEPE